MKVFLYDPDDSVNNAYALLDASRIFVYKTRSTPDAPSYTYSAPHDHFYTDVGYSAISHAMVITWLRREPHQ